MLCGVTTRTKRAAAPAEAATAGRPLAEILALPAFEGAEVLPADGTDGVMVSVVVVDDPAGPV